MRGLGLGLGFDLRRAFGEYNPQASNLAFLTSWEGVDGATTATDDSPDARTISFVNQAQIDTDVPGPFGPSSLYLPGSNSYCSTPHAAELSISNSLKLTVEQWVRPTAACIAKSAVGVVNKRDGSGAEEFSIYLVNGVPQFQGFRLGSTAFTIAAATSLVADQWHLLAIARDTYNYHFWFDGDLIGSTYYGTDNLSPNTQSLLFGRDGFTTGREFIGHYGPSRVSNEHFLPEADYTVPTEDFPRP